MKYKLVIFDMDGTILDTLEDLTDCLNFALRKNGYPEHGLNDVRGFVGNGIRTLMIRALPSGTSDADVDKLKADFTDRYKNHCMDKTKPYDGIIQLINSLKRAGCKVAVASNKDDYAVQLLCERYFPGVFDFAVGNHEGINRKPHQDMVNKVLHETNICQENAVYIGDSEVDIETAKNANLDHIIVLWGFRDRSFLEEHGGKVFAESPEDISETVLGK